MNLPDKITRRFIREHRGTIFVFGDNVAGKGYGGQAAEARGEPNVLGIPTKWRPDNRPESFFTDAYFHGSLGSKHYIDCAFDMILEKKRAGWKIAFFPNIGTGFAHLQVKAPKTLAYIQAGIREVEEAG